MTQALITRTLTAAKLNDCFERAVDKQYTRDLLFGSVFHLMSLVVTHTFSSVNAAYKENKNGIGVSITSVYNKLNGLETSVSANLVRETAADDPPDGCLVSAIVTRLSH